jgi:hypothetical protein
MYQLINNYDGNESRYIKMLSTGILIPKVADNTDYQEYLAWLAEGNEPLPADEP